MMRLTKRVFSAFLAFVMVFTMLPLDAWAADGNGVSGDSVVAPLAGADGPEAVGLELDQSSAVIQIGGTATFVPTVTMEDGSTQKDIECIWVSDHPEVARVTDGMVTGVAEGTAKITCTYGELTTFAMVTVTKATFTVLYKSNYPSEAKKYIYTYVEENDSGKFTSVIETPNNTTYNETYNPGESVTVAKNIFTTINYQLTGFKDVKTGETYEPGQSLGEIDRNYTLEAQWKEISGASTADQTIQVVYHKTNNDQGNTKYVSATVQNVEGGMWGSSAQVTFLTANIQDALGGVNQTNIRGWTIDGSHYEFNQQVTVEATKSWSDQYWRVDVYPWTESTGAGTAPAQFYVRRSETINEDGSDAKFYYSVGGGTIKIEDSWEDVNFGSQTPVAGNDDRTTDVSGYIVEAPSAAQIANLMNLQLNEAASVRWYVIKKSDNGYHVDGYVYSPGKYWKVEFVDPDSDRVVHTLLIEDQQPLDGTMNGTELNTELRKFQYWSKSKDGEQVDLSTIEVTQDIKLYAVFDRKSGYTVEHYFQNANDDGYTKEEKYTQRIVDRTDEFVTATPWDPDPDGFKYNDEESSGTKSGTVNADGTLVLKLFYDRIKYDVKYEYEGETRPDDADELLPKTTQYKYGATVKVAGEPNVPGYKFSGWRVQNTSSGVTIIDGEFTMPNQSVTLVGSWEQTVFPGTPITVEVIKDGEQVTASEYVNVSEYKEGGGTEAFKATPVGDNIQVTYKYYNLNCADITLSIKSGVDITGYDVSVASNSDSQTVGEVDSSQIATYKLTQVGDTWNLDNVSGGAKITVRLIRKSYTVTYAWDGAAPEGAVLPNGGHATEVKYGDPVSVVTMPNVPGYTFNGWSVKEGGVDISSGTFNMPAENVVLVGKWTANDNTQYQVQWYYQNADGSYPTTTSVTENRYGITDTEATVTDADKAETKNDLYVYDKENPSRVESDTIKGDGTTVLKLYFKRAEFSVKYEYSNEVDGAPNPPEEQDYKWGTTGIQVGTAPTLEGYVFSGWTTEDATVENNSFTMPQQDVTFTGSWTKLYTVTYNPNGGVGSPYTVDVKDGENHTVLDNTTTAFTKTNYHFVGWNTKADGTGARYEKDDPINNITDNIILYAQWEIDEKVYTIEYYLDGTLVASPYEGAPTGSSADINSTVNVTELTGYRTSFDNADGHYVLDEGAGNVFEITIDADATQNVLKVYYASDNKGNEKDPDTPDEIPDKYQVIFRYVPDSNGSITGITHETITKTDDVTTAKPTGTTFAADDGYKFQKWTRSTDNTEDNDKEMGTFKEPSYIWGSEVTFTVHFTKLDNLSYTIHHYLLGTTVKVADDTTDIGTFQDTVRVEAAKSFISGYEKAKYDSKTTETITITTGTNEATVYYKMPLTIKADDARRDYNGQPLTCGTFTVDGLVNDDNQNEISLSMTAESTITDAGWVDNVIDEKTVGGVKPYYEVTYEKGTLTIDTIDNLVVTISGNQKQEVYNGQTQNVSGYTAKFTVGDQEVTGVYDLDDFTYGGESTTASGKDAETYTVELDQTKFTWKDATNFEGVTFVVEKDIVLTITPKPITVTAINLEMDYGKTVPTPKINKEDLDAQLANGDTIQYTPYIDFKGANEDKPPVGTYDIKFEETDGVQGNYNVTYVPATLTVNAPSDFPYVTKGHENGTFDSAGDEVTFNITVYNIYDVPAAVELREQTGVTFIAAEGATLSENGTVLNDTLDPNSSKTYQATYTVTQADLRNGKIDNTVDLALTVGEDTIYDTATDSVIGLEAEATLAVEKTVQNPQASYGPGETITYNIKVTNTGNQTLTDVTLTDTLKADEAVVGNLTITGYDGPFELTPGEFKNFTVTYEVKEADLGKTLRNFATATAENPKEGEEDVTGTGNTPGEETDTPNPKLDVKKTLENAHEDGSSFKLGEEIRYKIVVTNTGNVTIKGIVVSDVMHEKLADGTLEKIDEGTVHYAGEGTFSGILEPEQSATFTFEYTVQEADLGKTLVNIATATGEDPRDSEKDITGTGNTPGEKTDSPNPKLDVEKTVENADGTPFKLGETIKYKIVVTNTGNVTLTGINVTDKMTHKNGDGTLLTGGVLLDKNDEPSNGVIEKLVPKGQEGESSATFYYTYVVQESDLGKTIVNTATAAGNENKEDPGKGEVEVTPDTRNPELKVVKTASTPKDEKDFALGETIDYTITLTNTGNVTLNVSIRDFFGTQDDASTVQEDITEKLICTDKDFNGTLRPEASVKYTYSYKVTEADLGKDIVNTVEYTALDDTNVPAQQNEESVTEVTSQTDDPDPDLAVEKKVVKDAGYKPTGKDENGNDVYALDDTIHYRITVSNTGNVTLTNVSVEDVLKDSLGNVIKPLDLTGAKNFTLVPVGQTGGVSSKTFDVYYTVKEENLGKTLVNTVTAASGQTQPDPEDPNNDDHDETDGEKTEKPSPNMSVTKEVVDKQISYRVGDVITYQITVTNTGNTTIHNVELMDHMNAHGKVTFKDLGDGQMVGGSPVLAALAPKTAWVVTCQYTVQLADADSDGNVISNKVVVTSDGGPSDDAETSGEKIDPIYTVVIKYQNGAGADLHDPAVVKVHDGQKYSVDSPNVPGYHLTNANQKTVSGTLDADSPYISEEGVLTLVVVYARNPVEDDDDDPVVNPDNDPDETTEETEDEVDPGVYIEDPDDYTLTPITEEEPPLADLDVGDHTCCIMHFLLMLAAMVVLGFYTDSKKKHQARIFELKRTLAMEKGKNPDGDNSQQS